MSIFFIWTKAISSEKVIGLNICIRKKKDLTLMHYAFTSKKQEKEKQIKPKASRSKEIIVISTKINKSKVRVIKSINESKVLW